MFEKKESDLQLQKAFNEGRLDEVDWEELLHCEQCGQCLTHDGHCSIGCPFDDEVTQWQAEEKKNMTNV